MRTSYPPIAADSIADRAIRLAERRARAEVELLACIAPSPRWLIPIIELESIREDYFAEADTRAIYAALCLGRKYPDVLRRVKLVRYVLRELGHWDDADLRRYVCGSRWSDASLATLFCRLPADPAMTRQAARKLLAVDAQQRAIRQEAA